MANTALIIFWKILGFLKDSAKRAIRDKITFVKVIFSLKILYFNGEKLIFIKKSTLFKLYNS